MTFNSVFPFAYFATPQGHGFWQQLQESFLEEDLAPAAKPAKLHKWEPVDLIDGSHRTQANGAWYDRLLDAQSTINTMGRKIAALQNRLAKEKKA